MIGGVVVILFILALLFKRLKKEEFRLLLTFSLFFRVISCVFITWWYVDYKQEGDLLAFLTQAKALLDNQNSFFEKFIDIFLVDSSFTQWEIGSSVFLRVVSLFMLFFDNSYILSLIYSLLVFYSMLFGLRLFKVKWEHLELPLILSFFLVPSVVMWSSAMAKDGLVLAFSFIIVGLWSQFRAGKYSLKMIVIFVFLLVLLTLLRFYVGGILLIVCVVDVVVKYKASWVVKSMLLLMLFFIGWYFMYLLHPWMRIQRLPLTLYEIHQQILLSGGGLTIPFPSWEPTYLSLLVHLPLAFLTGMFRPFPWELTISLALFPFILENLLGIVGMVYSLKIVKKYKKLHEIWIVLVYIIILAVFTGISIPNFGSLLRYKIMYFPWFILLISILPLQNVIVKRKVS